VLFLIGGCIGLISDAATGHGLSLLPFVLIPFVMIAFFFALTGKATNSARSDWNRMENWLSQLLDLPDQPPT
jgi:hypothetical protein